MEVSFVQNINQKEIKVDVCYQEYNEDAKKLVEYINKYKSCKDTFIVKSSDSYQIVKINEIECIEVFGDMITIITKEEEIKFRGRLYKVLEELNSSNFAQVSKSAVININYLIKLEALFSGMVAVLESGNKVSVSRSYLKELKNSLGI
ncbi:MAG: LytR/AlgR family response regulator transcription factor [Bacilli bacterium]